jgi:dTDP-4-amino-4,6-dideoxygalactose transaminase
VAIEQAAVRQQRTEFLSFSPPDIGADEIDEVLDTLRSGWITTGPKTKQFEGEFAAFVDAPAAAAVNSCTAATMVALAALGIGPGDAVLTTTLTFVSTVHVIEHVGAVPILLDIDPATLNLDPALIDDAVRLAESKNLRPRAIIPVHFAGLPCDMPAIFAAARKHGLAVIEDAAHALPAAIGDRKIGSIVSDVPHAVAFSFYATKNLTTGEGGMLTGSEELIEEARLWTLHGMSRDAWQRYGPGSSWYYEVVRPGFKCNMTDIAAAMGIQQLRRLKASHARRAELTARYDEALAGLPIVLPPREVGSTHAHHLYPIQLRADLLSIDRQQFIAEMTERKIGTSVHFIPVHLHPYYRDKYSYRMGEFPAAESAFANLVSLPLSTRLTDDDTDDAIDAVRCIVESVPQTCLADRSER